MAYIKKDRARKEIARDIPSPSVSNWQSDGGLRFNLQIGDYKVSLTHMERDIIIERWHKQACEFGES